MAAPNRHKAKNKKLNITLSPREAEMLGLFARENGTTRPAAIRRILREHLRDYASRRPQSCADNQLGLFDTLQIDIFDRTSRVVNNDDN